MTRRRNIFRSLVATAAVALLAVPVALAAPTGPDVGQRIDMKVLLLTPNASDGVYLAWRDTLTKLGVQFDAYTAGTSAAITDATLADYANNRSRYQAVINASSATSISASERAALDKAETTFGLREIADNTNPDAAHGATPLGGGNTTAAQTAKLTAAGLSAFPYLKGDIPIPSGVFAAAGTPGPSFTSLVDAPTGGSYMGVYKRPNGTEQLVNGTPGNGAQSHYQLMRFGLLNWVTRGAYLGYWRNYFEVQVDDLFLGDDAWNPATHANDFDPAKASRMTSADLAKTLAWSKANNFRFDFAFNAGGHDQFLADNPGAADTLWNAFGGAAGAEYRAGFGFINHTYSHPFLGCSTASFITNQITQNLQAAATLGLPTNAQELVTGEHSGLANSKPGNPGVLDPPSFDTADPQTTATGTLPAGTYYYAVTVSNTKGQTPSPEPIPVTVAPASAAGVTPVVAAENSVRVTASTICKGSTYALYRGTTATGPWTLVDSLTQNADTATDNGTTENAVTLTDTGAAKAAPANVATAPPTTDTAAMDPYAMNPNFTTGLANAGVQYTATDSSKTYPVETNATTPTAITGAQNPAGSVFTLPAPGGKVIKTVPRYPTNVYYNASKQGQQLDEYNWIYTADNAATTSVAEGGCQAIPNVTTCNTAPLTWDQYLASERTIVFGHLTGNDPRPHYAHQSNFADYNPALAETTADQGGTLYPYLDNILSYYRGLYADNAPIVQLSSTDIYNTLARQQSWAAAVAAGKVTSYIKDNQMHITTTEAMQVPVTGSTQGTAYAGNTSGWISTAANVELVLDLKNPITVVAAQAVPTPAAPAAPAPQGAVKGATVTKGAKPSLTKLKLSTRKFGAARKGLAKSKSSTKVSWTLNRAATVRLVIQRNMAKKGKKASWLSMGTVKVNGKTGSNKVTFTGKLGSRKVTKGSYRVIATATASDGQSSKAKSLTFSVVKR